MYLGRSSPFHGLVTVLFKEVHDKDILIDECCMLPRKRHKLTMKVCMVDKVWPLLDHWKWPAIMRPPCYFRVYMLRTERRTVLQQAVNYAERIERSNNAHHTS